MSEFFTINDGQHVRTDNVTRIRALTDDDRAAVNELGDNVNGNKYNTRIETGHGGQTLAEETIDQIAEKGVGLIQIDEGSFVPAQNIVKSRNLTDQDRQNFKERTGREMREDLKSEVFTRGGKVLSTNDAAEVMRQMGSPYRSATDNKPIKLSEQRQEVLENAARERSSGKKKAREQEQTAAPEPSQ